MFHTSWKGRTAKAYANDAGMVEPEPQRYVAVRLPVVIRLPRRSIRLSMSCLMRSRERGGARRCRVRQVKPHRYAAPGDRNRYDHKCVHSSFGPSGASPAVISFATEHVLGGDISSMP